MKNLIHFNYDRLDVENSDQKQLQRVNFCQERVFINIQTSTDCVITL